MNEKKGIEIISKIITGLVFVAIVALIAAGAVAAVKMLIHALMW